ncbi:hypothetical protein D9M69_507610 [compost metagenome]
MWAPPIPTTNDSKPNRHDLPGRRTRAPGRRCWSRAAAACLPGPRRCVPSTDPWPRRSPEYWAHDLSTMPAPGRGCVKTRCGRHHSETRPLSWAQVAFSRMSQGVNDTRKQGSTEFSHSLGRQLSFAKANPIRRHPAKLARRAHLAPSLRQKQQPIHQQQIEHHAETQQQFPQHGRVALQQRRSGRHGERA